MTPQEMIARAKRIARGKTPLATEVSPGLWVGSEESCQDFDGAVVHACKHPCFEQERARREVASGSLAHVEDATNLWLNMYDPPYVIDQRWAFRKVLEWTTGREKLLTQCNQGFSRSPSLMMAIMHRRGLLQGSDYDTAWKEFELVYPQYRPSAGMRMWLLEYWPQIIGK